LTGVSVVFGELAPNEAETVFGFRNVCIALPESSLFAQARINRATRSGEICRIALREFW